MCISVSRPVVRSILLLGLAALALPAPPADGDELPLNLTAFAVNLSGVGRARTERLDVRIERWTTDEERKVLIDTLVESGSDALLDAVQKIKPRAGYIRTTTSLAWDIQYVRQTELPDGARRIVFATDRPMSFFELRNRPRSAAYEFMLGEIRLGKDGKGEGKLAPAAKITYDRNSRTIELENYAREPVRLTQVLVEK